MGDIKLLSEDPIENVNVCYLEHNMFEYYFLIHGLHDDYEGGEYIGKIKFTNTYPMSPPEYNMITPSGRFEEGKKICLDNSGFHPDKWDPRWTIHAIINGFLSIFYEDKESGLAHIKKTQEQRHILAKKSIKWNEEYGKNNNNIYNILKTEYLGHEVMKQRLCASKDKSPTKTDKNKKDQDDQSDNKVSLDEMEKLAKMDKQFKKQYELFKKNIGK